jgi:hypothetical protein
VDWSFLSVPVHSKYGISTLSSAWALLRKRFKSSMKIEPTVNDNSTARGMAVPEEFWPALMPVARRVFWWGKSADWMEDSFRFVAQVMVFGDWNDTVLTWKLLGDSLFRQVLAHAPAGVFDPKSWTYWHHHYHMEVPALPGRF